MYLFDRTENHNWVFDPTKQIRDAISDAEFRRLIWSGWDGSVRAWDLAGGIRTVEHPRWERRPVARPG